ncbi:MAG: ABC transporter ATP-binding protein [Rhodobacteraceae bacterium]|nr:ABC transporter ATP-binding protein [Paracoccaceae bacterium]
MRISDRIDAFLPSEGPPPETLWAFMRWALSGSWGVLIFAALISSIVGGLEAVTALVLGWVTDLAVNAGPEQFFAPQNLIVSISAVVFFLVLRPLTFGLLAVVNNVVVGANIMPLVLTRLFRWTQGQSVGFFDNDFAGRIAQKQGQTSRALSEVVVESINVVTFALASLLATLAVLGAINGRVAMLFCIWLVGYLTLIRWFLPRVRARAEQRAGARADVTGQIVDTVTNIKTVKLFAHEAHEDRAALGAIVDLRNSMLAFGWLSAGFRFSLMLIAGALPVLMVGATILVWQVGGASAGDIVAAGVVSIRISQMTGWVSFALMGIYAAIGEVENGMNTLTPPDRLTDGPDNLTISKGVINFEGVHFAYGRKVGGISDVNLTIHSGEKLGIVGASGAGKSTLVATLLRLYDIEAGVIRIDGQDISAVTQESLRRAIGMVTQETAMFNRSARDNILYGRPDASEAEVVKAAKRAEAHEFIPELQDHKGRQGYDAFLGERGVKLSGGQRQRIALARAILKDAPILVLDEATSALDSHVEAAIQTALERVMEGKTVLAIAHRLSTIAQMDRIVVLDKGHIAETGSHADLLAANGIYAGLWARQSGGFLGEK